MSDEAIRALDSDLEQSRNAFLRAREAQRRLNLNTHDVNRMGANKSRSDSITPGVIHTHDVIRLGANGSQSDSTITHDVNSNTHDVNRSGAQSRLDSNTHDVTQSRLNSNTHDATPDPRKDAPHASERTRQELPGSPMTVAQDVPPSPEAARARDAGSSTTTATNSETQCLEGIRAPRGRVPPSPTTLLIEQAERGVREAVEGIPGEGILTPLTGRQKQHSQESGQPLSPSTYHTMGDGPADHEPAVAATGGSEPRDASKVERVPLTPREFKEKCAAVMAVFGGTLDPETVAEHEKCDPWKE